MGGARITPLYDPTNASSAQRMLEEFFQGVKTYVDERLIEVRDERPAQAGAPRDIGIAELDERFNAHAVNDQGMTAINESRQAVFELATVWLSLLPAGRDKSLAYTALEEASFHATAAISRQKGNQS